MDIRRFYVEPGTVELKRSFWLHDEGFRQKIAEGLHEGDQLVLFDGSGEDRLYKLSKVEPDGVHLEMVTEFERKLPGRHIYIFWAVLPGDKNDGVIWKYTQLGVSNFVPLITEKGEKAGFDIVQARKVVVTAVESGEWSLVPHIREPLTVEEAVNEYGSKVDLLVASSNPESSTATSRPNKPLGILIGPEAGWTEAEMELFRQNGVGNLHLSNPTSQAETDAISAVTGIL